MFRNRVMVFYFHRRSELPAGSFKWIDEYLRYVRDHSEVFWYMLHRFSIKIKAAKGEPVDPLRFLLANTLYDRRRELPENIDRGMEDRVKRFIKNGVPASVFEEPGIWVYPAKICYMYLTDPSTLNAQSDPYSLAEPIEMAE
ncbi:hypothetical protein PHYSODRAFT_264726 [Phytophthora sojae]|uniref:Uncharacterized protein n=1 Tax=Phytophthora sojae (strain P6497) TaxID=1094619 RepID=G5A269_PHYSP|nr:hypothetical protein PHYSODRAFT_264726 [Phytophthora sojae]EGZ11017.1 hypothetical protein PHYSODRAFT_264726 [Phytophthora sojae]|eukprot:XP_009533762.1 hypothetical protein PHYSODRAFT_264726 [Phytophthora sojae]